jgi:hypothetical protein
MKTNKKNFTTTSNVCTLATTDMPDIGTFYNQTDAKARLDNYFSATGVKPTDPKVIFGQLLGINTVKTLIDKIDTYNNGLPAADQITGIRFYNAMSVRPELPPPDDTAMLADIVLLPVLADGTDIFSVHAAADPMMALSGAMPCPNECGTGFYLS